MNHDAAVSIQINIMLILFGFCLAIIFCIRNTSVMSEERKRFMLSMNLSAAVLMFMDRLAYLYRGQPGTTAFWIVRISNFLVFLMPLSCCLACAQYLNDLLKNEGGVRQEPKGIRAARWFCWIGMAMVVISQFTGLYYTIDETNTYHRVDGFLLSYFFPLIALMIILWLTVQYARKLSKPTVFSVLLFSLAPMVASLIQIFTYGISLTNITLATIAPLLYFFSLTDLNRAVKESRKREEEIQKADRKRMDSLFRHTAEALAATVDAKDTYTNGHSFRVAKYSTMIAQEAGMAEEECTMVYYAALLHDVGKIGIPNSIINKKDRLTDEEFAIIKTHPVIGNQILSKIREAPFLHVGAHYHHERYDGGGYPEGLKGMDIPQYARIVAVADAYDAMTSKRSYRETIPQQRVREQIVEGIGTQFDPEYARIMLHLIDLDTEYALREGDDNNQGLPTDLECGEYRATMTSGIQILRQPVEISFLWRSNTGADDGSFPALIVFDSLDQLVHDVEKYRKEFLYCEYAEIIPQKRAQSGEIREMRKRSIGTEGGEGRNSASDASGTRKVVIRAMKFLDHLKILISVNGKTEEYIIALNDSSRYAYISLTGVRGMIANLTVRRETESITEDEIERIAPKISFIDVPEGDVPNVQVDNYRSAATKGIPIGNGMEVAFHTMSLPTARLVWHCPFMVIFTSKDSLVYGEEYQEYSLIRLDGEDWEEKNQWAEIRQQVNKLESFTGWNDWKEKNRTGFDVRIRVEKTGPKQYTVHTENLGIFIRNVITIQDDTKPVLLALTGDQVALTNIRLLPV